MPRMAWVTLAAILVAGALLGYGSYDVHEYVGYAHQWLTPPLFSRWPREYPPAAVLVMLPALAGRTGFMVATGLVAAVLALVLARRSAALARRWIWLVMLGGLLTIVARYDVWPALAATLAVTAGSARAWRAAWWWTLVAAVLKLFGLVLWPVLLAAEWRETGRLRVDRLVFSGLLFLASWLLPWLVAGSRAFSTWKWLVVRPVEIGSIAAPVLAALGGRVAYRFYSFSVLSRWDRPAEAVLTALAVAGVLLAAAEVARGQLSWERGAAMAVTWLVIGGKVLSVQYLLWLYPLWVLAWPEGLPASTYLTALLTTVVYPFLTGMVGAGGSPLYWVAQGLRDVALVAVGIEGMWPSPPMAGKQGSRPGPLASAEFSAGEPG
jgi:hypothetical protein